MNKKIKDATKNEIASTIKNGAYRIIGEKRKKATIYGELEEETGELHAHSCYALKNAENEGLSLEYRLYNSNHIRKERVKERISNMVNTNHAYFLTLTFSDKMFSRRCSAETRRRYIRRFLREQCKDYLANIDFGSNNEREHYHAVVIPKSIIDFAKYRELFDSSINCKRIIKSAASEKLLSRYISKLTNHALKENGFYKRLIFSRNNAWFVSLSYVRTHLSWYDSDTN